MAEILSQKGHIEYAESTLDRLNEKMKGRKPLFPVTMICGINNEFIVTVIVE